MLVEKLPVPVYQNTDCLPRATGRIAPRSLRETDSARERAFVFCSQSISVVPRNRLGDAPGAPPPITGAVGSSTPAEFWTIPVLRGNRPDIVEAWPGAVSVIPGSWKAFVKTAPPRYSLARPPVSSDSNRVR